MGTLIAAHAVNQDATLVTKNLEDIGLRPFSVPQSARDAG
jgi:hypothetical protein